MILRNKLKNYSPNSNIHFRLGYLLFYLEKYFSSTKNIDNIKIYSSVILKNRSIIRATENFYGKAWYSNVEVEMNSEEQLKYLTNAGYCYGQVNVVIFLKKICLKY